MNWKIGGMTMHIMFNTREELEQYYKSKSELACPHLRYDYENKVWVAIDKIPCYDCQVKSCHQNGNPAEERIAVLKLNGGTYE